MRRASFFIIVAVRVFALGSVSGFAAVLDPVTEPPTLISPATDSVTTLPITISYTLPEPALPGSVTLTFDDGQHLTRLTMIDDLAVSFAWDGAGASSPEITGAQGPRLFGGAYTATLAYQDSLGNPAASDVSTNVTIDAPPTTTTTTPTTTSTTSTTLGVTTTTTVAATTTTVAATSTTLPATTTTAPSTTTTTVPSPCGNPFNPSTSGITAGDALFVLRAAVGLQSCDGCICDINNSGGTNASDALQLLRIAQGLEGQLLCPVCVG